MTALAACKKLMKESGRVVICILNPGDVAAVVGRKLKTFSGGSLASHKLLIYGFAHRNDWAAQLTALGMDGKYKAQRGHRFFFARLEKA